jgi:hypothetical protein
MSRIVHGTVKNNRRNVGFGEKYVIISQWDYARISGITPFPILNIPARNTKPISF